MGYLRPYFELNDLHIVIWFQVFLFNIDYLYTDISSSSSSSYHGYPRRSFSASPYHSSPPAGIRGYIPYHHIAAV